MLYEYAIDPELFGFRNQCLFIFESFSPSRGRMISRFPKNWKSLVWETIKSSNLSPIQLKKMEIWFLKLTRRCLVQREDSYWKKQPWLKNAEEEHKCRPFQAILANQVGSVPETLHYGNLDIESRLWKLQTTRRVSRQAAVFAATVQSFLSLSSHVLFIDPHFRPFLKRFKRPFLAFTEILRESLSIVKTSQIELHFSAEDEVEAKKFCTQTIQELERKVPKFLNIQVFVWKKDEEDRRFHNRYILSDIGGVSFLHGLDDNDDKDSHSAHDEIQILDVEAHAELWEEYASQCTDLVLLADTSFAGKKRS